MLFLYINSLRLLLVDHEWFFYLGSSLGTCSIQVCTLLISGFLFCCLWDNFLETVEVICSTSKSIFVSKKLYICLYFPFFHTIIRKNLTYVEKPVNGNSLLSIVTFPAAKVSSFQHYKESKVFHRPFHPNSIAMIKRYVQNRSVRTTQRQNTYQRFKIIHLCLFFNALNGVTKASNIYHQLHDDADSELGGAKKPQVYFF